MAMGTLAKRKPPAHLRELVDRVVEAVGDPRYKPLKDMWTRHNRLQKTRKTPVFVCLKKGSGRSANPVTWSELIPPETRVSTDPLEREIELQLRQKLYKHDHIPDDDVLVPTVWIRAVPPRDRTAGGDRHDSGGDAAGRVLSTGPSVDAEGKGAARLWGLPFRERRTDDPGGAYAVDPVVTSEADVDLLHPPQFEIDEPATRSLVERAQELVDGRLPVKVKTDEVGWSPTETMVSLMGMEAVLYGVIDRPQFIHRIMDFITDGTIAYHRQREEAGAFEPDETWGYRVPYEALPRHAETKQLAFGWMHIGAQSMCGLSPAMYEEFVQPYHARMTEAVAGHRRFLSPSKDRRPSKYHAKMTEAVGAHRVYYHGCEDLTEKIGIIGRLPYLRRFHVSAWTNLEEVARRLGSQFVFEVCTHPDTLHVHSREEMRKDVDRIMEIAGGCAIDIVLGEIETVFGEPSVLRTWTEVAQERVARYD